MLSAAGPTHAGPVRIPMEHGFSPYTDNGGTTLAIAGDDYVIVAGDTRQSEGYSINTRYCPKVFKLDNNCVLATGGMAADGQNLVRRLKQSIEQYHHVHAKTMSPSALAQLLSVVLYGKRHFPYFVWNTLGGLDADGSGWVYSYDPVGNVEKRKWACAGSAGHLIMPFLDAKIGHHHQSQIDAKTEGKPGSVPFDTAMKYTKDAFTSATERDIYTGDLLEIFVIRKSGVTVEQIPLKRD
ncbi:hypothetical protein CXG81DRAFT_27560 [Caulochytrium protostelioides]|uniref:Proteasome subunit beta n=1 Tax=Caulochytrium protostelioides TaxID=1555241 RepID=A0A4P9X3S6_9FUNG|nr:hypothetical protein CXG81DRAFT_27560 [Caulochytrium protostelioides]|eukprot:RKO99696.1 hypothetical protein CXG81DRAFT_27560 [Caulochytrium protostelioides]